MRITKEIRKILEDEAVIKDDLEGQLAERGVSGKHYDDLIKDYCAMWYAVRLAEADIRKRGIYITYDNGGGQKGVRKNDSVDTLIKSNAQMLRILSELGLKPVAKVSEASEPQDI